MSTPPHPTGKDHPNWKGGIWKNEKGYIRFGAGINRGKYVHRMTADRCLRESLGRGLRADEEVHHLCRNRGCYPPSDFHLLIVDAAIHHFIESRVGGNAYGNKYRGKSKRNGVQQSH